jgi:hypothetical protein
MPLRAQEEVMAGNPIAPSVTAVTVDAGGHQRPYVDWPAIFAGAVIAGAISFVLVTFGAGIGLSLTSPYAGEGMALSWYVLGVGLWMIWAQVTAFGAGAYVAGRLRRRVEDATEHEVDIRDGAHGLIVWAVGVLLGAFVAFSGITDRAGTDVGRVVASQVEATEQLPQAGLEQAQTARPATEAERAAADRTRRLGILLAFMTAASLLVSAAASVVAAKVGGDHRDHRTVTAYLGRGNRPRVTKT